LWGQCGVEIRPYAIQPDSENTECWQFTGFLDAYGYGCPYSDNKEVKAHRAFYEAFEGPLPDGKYLQHHLPQSDASAMPAAIRTISCLTIRHGVRFQVERRTAPKGEASGPVCNAEWKRKASKRHQMRCKVLTFRPANSLEVAWSRLVEGFGGC